MGRPGPGRRGGPGGAEAGAAREGRGSGPRGRGGSGDWAPPPGGAAPAAPRRSPPAAAAWPPLPRPCTPPPGCRREESAVPTGARGRSPPGPQHLNDLLADNRGGPSFPGARLSSSTRRLRRDDRLVSPAGRGAAPASVATCGSQAAFADVSKNTDYDHVLWRHALCGSHVTGCDAAGRNVFGTPGIWGLHVSTHEQGCDPPPAKSQASPVPSWLLSRGIQGPECGRDLGSAESLHAGSGDPVCLEQKMSAADFGEDVDEALKTNPVKVESEAEAAALDCTLNSRAPLDGVAPAAPEGGKRRQPGSDGQQLEAVPSVKRRRLIPEALLAGMRTRDSSSPCQGNGELAGRARGEEDPCTDTATPSYKKPLYGISHKIMEKKHPPAGDSLGIHDLFEKATPSNSPSPLRLLGEAPKRDCASTAATDGDPNIYVLIQKMFYLLNTLTSSMSQLHSKVDLLSLEVSRIKKQVSPPELVAKFQPPPEYQLMASELKQIAEQSLSAGDLACRLLVQLFPELFSDVDCACGFTAKRKPESLHLQLVRSYVEVYYPSVADTAVWQAECLPQLNDFFSRFWAQRDMEDAQPGSQVPSFFEGEPVDAPGHFLDGKEQEEALSLDRSSTAASEPAVDTQDLTEFLDEASSPGEFAVFLLHRLFPELFDHRRLGEQYSCYGDGGRQELDPQRLQVIRNYTEIYFPDMQEEAAWLQQCAQRLDDELEGLGAEGGSDGDAPRDDCYDSCSLPDDVSVVKVEDGLEGGERPAGRRSKKIWLVPVDFDKLDIPPPDFEVAGGAERLLSRDQLRAIYESSLSIGNFASRLLVHLFPELFTHENLRKQYNCSGSLGKKQLDPARIRLIRHYVQLLYPRARNDRVWTLEFVGKLDERCRRRDTEQRRSYQQQRRGHAGEGRESAAPPHAAASAAHAAVPTHPERFRDEFEAPPLPPERSSKDFCKIPLDELVVPAPDFPVPPAYLLSDKEVREIVQQSLSVGNFAARLLVRLFPELFTAENLRLQYNHSGACNKKQLDPARLRLIRHYVEAVYPVDKMEEVWHYECVPSIDERCRRPNRKKCDILKKAKKVEK
ncbi:BEN domain-containing protein 3 [Ctenodactylus gundi]